MNTIELSNNCGSGGWSRLPKKYYTVYIEKLHNTMMGLLGFAYIVETEIFLLKVL